MFKEFPIPPMRAWGMFLRDLKKYFADHDRGGNVMKYYRKIQFALVRVFFVATAMMLGSTSILYAASEIPYTFSPGQTISSAQVNANFQALSAQIAALQAQLVPVSIVGTYDYFSFGIGMEVGSFGATQYTYSVTRNSYQGTLVFDASGTVTSNGTGGYDYMRIQNETDLMCGQNCSGPYVDPRPFSIISASFSHEYPTDIGTGSYTLNGSTITVVGGFVGTLSADGKIIVGTFKSNATGIVIGIRRQ